MSSKKQLLGILGEKLAIDYLRGKGYSIIQHHKSFRQGEIDIIAEKKDELIFVEVKTRTNRAFGYPEESITERKRERIEKAVEQYLLEFCTAKQEYRIDLIVIELDRNSNNADLRHYRGFF